MELLIFKIVVIVCLIRLIFLQIGHLYISFNKEGNKMQVDEILKDPEKYVKWDHLETFMTNMIWLVFIIALIVAAFSGNVTFVNQ